MDKNYTNITYDGYLIKKEVKALEILNNEDNIYINKEYEKEAILRESSQDTENSQYVDDSYQLDFLILRVFGLTNIGVLTLYSCSF